MRHPLLDEAVLISREIPGAVFVGALAVFAHTKIIRGSEDIDLAIATLQTERLLSIGYTRNSNSKHGYITPLPREYKVDIFTKDVSEVPVTEVMKSSREIIVDNRKNTKLRVAALEVISLTKFRAARSQDAYDLQVIVQEKIDDMDWTYMRSICKSEYEFEDIKITLRHYKGG